MRRRTLLALAVALVGTLPAACGATPADRTPARTPVVVDTDMGPDDMLALLYLSGRPDVDLRAVTVSGTGLTRCPAGARHALQLLAAAGRADVPVACGPADPLAGFNSFPAEWRDRADELYGVALAPARRRPDARGAVALLREAIADAPGRVALLSLGPMTDTAALLRADPGVRDHLSGIYAMGGAVGVPGNVGPGHERAEFNVWVDPVAAARVLRAAVPVTLVGLDATRDVPVTVFFADAMRRRASAGRAAEAAWRIMRAAGTYVGGQYFWDPLAAAAVAEPGVLRLRSMRLAVDRDGSVSPDRGAAPVRVAVGAARGRFEAQLMRALLRGARFHIRSARTGATIACGATCRYRGPHRVVMNGTTAAFDTVNRGDGTMIHMVGHLVPGETPADLRAALARGAVRDALGVEAAGETPPHSRMTWLANLAPGRIMVIAGPVGAPRLVAVVDIRGAGS